jgi:hypothetical protein
MKYIFLFLASLLTIPVNASTIYNINASFDYNYATLIGNFSYDSLTNTVSNINGVFTSNNGATGHPYINDLANPDIFLIPNSPKNILSFYDVLGGYGIDFATITASPDQTSTIPELAPITLIAMGLLGFGISQKK